MLVGLVDDHVFLFISIKRQLFSYFDYTVNRYMQLSLITKRAAPLSMYMLISSFQTEINDTEEHSVKLRFVFGSHSLREHRRAQTAATGAQPISHVAGDVGQRTAGQREF